HVHAEPCVNRLAVLADPHLATKKFRDRRTLLITLIGISDSRAQVPDRSAIDRGIPRNQPNDLSTLCALLARGAGNEIGALPVSSIRAGTSWPKWAGCPPARRLKSENRRLGNSEPDRIFSPLPSGSTASQSNTRSACQPRPSAHRSTIPSQQVRVGHKYGTESRGN